jgi:hypothetical protein
MIAPLAGAAAGPRRVLSTGPALQAAGLAIFAYDAVASPSYLSLCLPLLLAGVGVSMAMPTGPTAALNAVSPAEIGSASGVSNTMQRFGGAFGIAIASAVFAGSMSALGALVGLAVAKAPASTRLAAEPAPEVGAELAVASR